MDRSCQRPSGRYESREDRSRGSLLQASLVLDDADLRHELAARGLRVPSRRPGPSDHLPLGAGSISTTWGDTPVDSPDPRSPWLGRWGHSSQRCTESAADARRYPLPDPHASVGVRRALESGCVWGADLRRRSSWNAHGVRSGTRGVPPFAGPRHKLRRLRNRCDARPRRRPAVRLVGDSRDGWRPFVAANIAGARPPDHSQRGWRAQRRLWRRDLRRPSHSNYLYFSNTSYLDSIAGHRGQPAAGSPEESRDLGRSLDRAAKNRSQELPPRGLRNTGAD